MNADGNDENMCMSHGINVSMSNLDLWFCMNESLIDVKLSTMYSPLNACDS